MRSISMAVLLLAVVAGCSEPRGVITGPSSAPEARQGLAPLHAPGAGAAVIADEYVVVFHPTVPDAEALATQLTRSHGGRVYSVWKGMKGFWGTLPSQAVDAIRRNPHVKYVEASVLIPPMQADTVGAGNWGLDRIDQRVQPMNGLYSYTRTGAGVRIWIVDTGVQGWNADLQGRIDYNSWFTYNGTDPFNPCYDHGTAVAVLAAGTTYGVAKGATINVARVSDDCASGNMSTGAIASAFNFIADYSPRPAVANASFGQRCDDWWNPWCGDAVDDAIRYAISRGVETVVAAGNDGRDACEYSPARVGQAITVGASASNDSRVATWWSSNYGSCLDLFAPGADLNVGYRYFNGTSAAAPMVTGVAALWLQNNTGAASTIINNATTGLLSNVGAGSPNRLLYSHLQPPPPSYSATIHGPGAIQPNATNCYWTASASFGGNLQYSWSVNDVEVGTAETLYYASSSSFTLTLSVWDGMGAAATTSRQIDVQPLNPQCNDY